MDNSNINDLIMKEVKRLTDKFGREYLTCDDLMQITGLGKGNVRALMRAEQFPSIRVGKRIVVTIFNFVTWQVKVGLGC